MKHGVWLVFVVMTLAACERREAGETTRSEGAGPAAPVASAIPSNIQRSGPDLQAAFVAAFGGPPPVRRAPEGTSESVEGGARTFSPSALVSTGDVYFLVSEGQGVYNEYDCHACLGGLMIHRLTRDASGYRVVGEWFLNDSRGGFGAPPDWSVRSDLFSRPALLVEGSYMAQGCSVAGGRLYELSADGLVLRADELSLSVVRPDGFAASGQLSAVERDRSFIIDYSGDGAQRVTYQRDGDQFVTRDDLSALPSC